MVEDREDRVEAAIVTPAAPEPAHWLEPLYREHAAAVVQAAYRVTGNAADAEDVLQTVFARLARRLEPPDLGPGAGAYLRRAATNAALDIVQSRRVRSSSDLAEAPTAALRDTAPDPDHLQLSRELRDRLRDALGTLNRRGAEMFALRYLEGLDNRQIADLLDTTPNTVAVTLHRVRGRMQEALAPYLGGSR